MIKLYSRSGCPFCKRTIAHFNRIGIDYEVIESSTPEARKELTEIAGKTMVPFMVHETSEGIVQMHESADIMKYATRIKESEKAKCKNCTCDKK